jgi:CheY-like chemotaxis protein
MSLDVLIADQDVELAKLYCRFLTNRGFSTEIATCGLECLTIVRQQSPNVVILDQELPWCDAKGVLACLREDGMSLPIILTTWNASPETVRQLVAPPVVLCLRKFFPLPALLDGVHRAVNHCAVQGVSSDCLEPTQQGDLTWNANRWSCSGHANFLGNVSIRACFRIGVLP